MKLFKIMTTVLCAAMLSSCIVIKYPDSVSINHITAEPSQQSTVAEVTDTPLPETEAVTEEVTEEVTVAIETEAVTTTPAETEAVTEDFTEAVETEIKEVSSELKTIFLISMTSPIYRNQTASIDIIGEPNTTYTIEVFYATGKSNAKGLEPKTSSDVGAVSWSWRIGPSLKTGRYRIVISGGGDSLETEIQVY